mmetsp:Transcript_9599/g.20361  ORF Transcript_9599/g.20361 Transcript_9599/m.20361 type:complete len:636 (+) Transcript_9599:42-1949(+)
MNCPLAYALLITIAALLLSAIPASSLSTGVSTQGTSSSSSSSRQHPQPGQQHVVVVGGGVGGLAIASRIASTDKSCKVTLLEKNSRDMLGGRCGSFDVSTKYGTFRHERGPSLLLLKDVYEELFTDCSGSIGRGTDKEASDYGLDIVQCIPAYQVVFDDGDRIELGFPQYQKHHDASALPSAAISEQESASIDKMNSYEANGYDKWEEYMAACSAFLDCGLPNFIEEIFDLPSFPAFIYQALRAKAKAWPLKPHSDVLDAIFDSEKMKALASFQDLYVGLEPYRNDDEIFGGVLRKTAPAVFGLLAALELHPTNEKAGVFAPVGGFRAVSRAFARLSEACGVQICCNTTVTQIENDGVHIIANGKSDFIQADRIVVNADLPFATESLLVSDTRTIANDNPQDNFDWDDSFDFSSGVVAFHWSVNIPCHDLNTHNVFLSASSKKDAVKSWGAVRENVRSDMKDDTPFNFYVHRASKTDPAAAPKGCDSIMVLVPTETLERRKEYAKLARDEAIERYKGQFDDVYVAKIRKAVLNRLSAVESLQGLENNIVNEVIDTPATYGYYYNLAAGTPFALSHGFSQLSLTRPSPRSKRLENTFFVGASTRPGNGVPLVLLGAKAVAQQVVEDMKTEQIEIAS